MVVLYRPQHFDRFFSLWDIAIHWDSATPKEREELRQRVLSEFPFLTPFCDIHVQMPHPEEWNYPYMYDYDPTMIYIDVYSFAEFYQIVLFPTGELVLLDDDFIGA